MGQREIFDILIIEPEQLPAAKWRFQTERLVAGLEISKDAIKPLGQVSEVSITAGFHPTPKERHRIYYGFRAKKTCVETLFSDDFSG